jgi:hypothetical protein
MWNIGRLLVSRNRRPRSVLVMVGLSLALVTAPAGAQECMVCLELDDINGITWHGFVSGSSWLCSGGGGEGEGEGEELPEERSGCAACGVTSECHEITEPTEEDPAGGMMLGPCHERCPHLPPQYAVHMVENWLASAPGLGGGPVLMLDSRGAITYDERSSVLGIRDCSGEVITQWQVPPILRNRILSHGD